MAEVVSNGKHNTDGIDNNTKQNGNIKLYSLEQLQDHVSKEDCWLGIDGKVYDVTEFLDEHPGGYDVVLQSAGRDATEDFENIGHSDYARTLLRKFKIGEVKDYESSLAKESNNGSYYSNSAAKQPKKPTSTFVKVFQIVMPLLLILIALGIKFAGDKLK